MKIELDFKLAKQDHANRVLKAIARQALDFLLKNINSNKIICILLTGSLSKSEGTFIQHKSSIVTSDFDFVVYLDFISYLKYKSKFKYLSQRITTRLLDRKINTHVEFLPYTLFFQTGTLFKYPDIYEYEFAHANKCVFGKEQIFNSFVRPTKKDALELTFTVVSDLVFTNLKYASKVEESYIFAKRALTLLNSLLIFHGFFIESYEKRIKFIQKCVHKKFLPITKDEIKILEIYTQYKLIGSFPQLLDSLSFSDISELLHFQREFLTNLTIKTLSHELGILTKEKHWNYSYNTLNKLELISFLREYFNSSKIPLPSRILGIILYVLWTFVRNRRKKELFTINIFYKQSPKTLLNVLITLLLIYDKNINLRKILEIFPWINDDVDTDPLQTLFLLWKTAENSVKL